MKVTAIRNDLIKGQCEMRFNIEEKITEWHNNEADINLHSKTEQAVFTLMDNWRYSLNQVVFFFFYCLCTHKYVYRLIK